MASSTRRLLRSALPALARIRVGAPALGLGTSLATVGFRLFAAAPVINADGYILHDESGDDTFDDLLEKHELVIAYFTASWCGPCKQIAPVFAEIAKQHGGSVTFIKVDVDKCENTANALRIRQVPTFQAYKGGQLKRQWSGPNPQMLEATVDYLKKS